MTEPGAAAGAAAVQDEPFAAYLERVYCEARGFAPSAEPEIAGLRAGCDRVLTRADGRDFSIVCLIDAEVDYEKRFWVERPDLLAAARACRRYARDGRGRVRVHVIEIGHTPDDPAEVKRLRRLRTLAHSRVQVDAWMVQPGSRAVWTNRAPGIFEMLLFGTMVTYAFDVRGADQRRVLALALREPRVPAGTPVALPRATLAGRLPLVSALLALILVAVYALELHLSTAGEGGPDAVALALLGDQSRRLVLGGHEWWRLLSAPFLHGSVEHLVGNLVALLWAGFLLEPLVGRAWTLALFAAGAVGGQLLSLAVLAPRTPELGASGAIMGLFAAAIVASTRLPRSTIRGLMQVDLVRILIAALVPASIQVASSAHLGGALAGGVGAILLLRTWPRGDETPAVTPRARALAAAGAGLFAVGFALVGLHYARASRSLIPVDRLDSDSPAARDDADELVRQWPDDPRGHLALGQLLMTRDDAAGAERELRTALADDDHHPLASAVSDPMLPQTIRWLLASTLYDEGKLDDAREIARPLCDDQQVRDSIRAGLKQDGICP